MLHYKLRTATIRRNLPSSAAVRLSSLTVRSDRSGHGNLNSNDAVRALVAELLTDGLSQVVLATSMGVSPTWFNRWINQKDDRTLPMSAVDGLLLYLHRHSRTVLLAIQGIEEAPLKARQEPLPAAVPPRRRHPHRRK